MYEVKRKGPSNLCEAQDPAYMCIFFLKFHKQTSGRGSPLKGVSHEK